MITDKYRGTQIIISLW